MKKLLLASLLCAIFLPAPAALITTNLIASLTVSTAFTNGGPVAYYTLNLPAPQTIINTHGGITNAAGTNSLMYCASITVTPTNLFQVFALGTNAQSETLIASQLTNNVVQIIVTGYVTNSPGTITNVSEQWQFTQ